jgi:peptidoglycan hydrolase-like protein with peptidoglycan-binding domain
VALAPPVAIQPQLSTKQLALAIQQELARLGCNPGTPDGDWGRRTISAITAFNQQTNLSLETAKPNADTLPVLKSTAGVICTAPPAQVKPVSTGYTEPKKKAPQTVKKKAPPKKKVKAYRGGEGARLDCDSGRKVTNECF